MSEILVSGDSATQNAGCFAENDIEIYYTDFAQKSLNHYNKKTKNNSVIYNGLGYSINIYEDYVYFINEDSVICCISRKDDICQTVSDVKVRDLIVYNNNFYFIGKDNSLCKMDLSGRNKQILVENKIEKYMLESDYIYYKTLDGHIYSFIDGISTQIVGDESISWFLVYNKKLYYLTESAYIYVYDMNTSEEVKLTNHLVVPQRVYFYGGNLYYKNIELNNELCIYDLDKGKERNTGYTFQNDFYIVNNNDVFLDNNKWLYKAV